MKAPGNYSDQFWSNKISVLLWEGPKPNMSMIYGFVSPGETLFMDLDIPKYLKNIRKCGNLFGSYDLFVNLIS